MRRIKLAELEEIEVTDVMYALSDPARLEIVKTLADGRPRTCGELNADRPKSSMSHHFKILRDSGLIKTRVEGKEHFNELRLKDLEKKFPGLLKGILNAL
jgi:DNA-binding transcriptional ArsR family regulator